MLMIAPRSKSGVVWENVCQPRNASLIGSCPVGRPVLPIATRAKRSGCSATSAQADQAAPVLAEERHVVEVELVEQQAAHPLDVAGVGVVAALGRLVRAAEADQVGGDAPQSGVDQHRDHRPVEEAPRRLAVHEQHDRAVGRALVEVVHAQRAAVAVGHLDVVRRERRSRAVRRSARRGCGGPSCRAPFGRTAFAGGRHPLRPGGGVDPGQQARADGLDEVEEAAGCAPRRDAARPERPTGWCGPRSSRAGRGRPVDLTVVASPRASRPAIASARAASSAPRLRGIQPSG